MSPPETSKPPDHEEVFRLFEQSARDHAYRLLQARLDAGMDPSEARESVRRFGWRLTSKVMRGVSAGTRDASPEMREGPPDG